jgi:hypothetical protein
MFYANMRVVAVGVAFSLAFLRIEELPEADPDPSALGRGATGNLATTLR